MSRGIEGMVSILVLRPAANAQVRVRGSLGRTAFLALGESIEITLQEAHVLALHGDIAAALGEIEVIGAAERVVGRAYDAGAQARRAADLALDQAEAVDRAGDGAQAARLREWARVAMRSADAAQVAVEDAERAMAEAEDVAERIAYAMSHAARASAGS